MPTLSTKDDVILGAGSIYVLEYTGTIPEDTVIEVDTNKVGHSKGGASLEYTAERKEVVDDMGVIVKSFVTKEGVMLKTGMLSWNVKQLNMLCSTGRITEDATKKVRTLKIGGKKNANNKSYVIQFVHTKDDGKKIRVQIVGISNNGFTLTFDAENETTIDAEFKAIASDTDGTLVTVKEEFAV